MQYDTQHGEIIQSPKKAFSSEERLLPSVMQTRWFSVYQITQELVLNKQTF